MCSEKHQSSQVPQPLSTHVEDVFLKDFLSPSFDPVDYLNSTLPSLAPSSATSSSSSLPLADLCNESQTMVSQLNMHTTRLTNALTQLTDEILRSGSRLAYQVELLRGETLSTCEALNGHLAADVAVFLPSNGQAAQEPPCMSQLRTLTIVRARLDSVIKTFGDAMEFVFPPSELSTSSFILSVSAPDPGADKQSTEEKGQEVIRKLREEILALLADPDDPICGIEKAAQRIEELKDISTVWKGTAEEKGRAKFIESLARAVEDRHRELLREVDLEARRTAKKPEAEPNPRKSTEGDYTRSYSPGLGLLNQLQRMRVGR